MLTKHFFQASCNSASVGLGFTNRGCHAPRGGGSISIRIFLLVPDSESLPMMETRSRTPASLPTPESESRLPLFVANHLPTSKHPSASTTAFPSSYLAPCVVPPIAMTATCHPSPINSSSTDDPPSTTPPADNSSSGQQQDKQKECDRDPKSNLEENKTTTGEIARAISSERTTGVSIFNSSLRPLHPFSATDIRHTCFSLSSKQTHREYSQK